MKTAKKNYKTPTIKWQLFVDDELLGFFDSLELANNHCFKNYGDFVDCRKIDIFEHNKASLEEFFPEVYDELPIDPIQQKEELREVKEKLKEALWALKCIGEGNFGSPYSEDLFIEGKALEEGYLSIISSIKDKAIKAIQKIDKVSTWKE